MTRVKNEMVNKMAVMSFAHLKNKKHHESGKSTAIAPSSPIHDVRKKGVNSGGVMSFAHLKKKPVVPQRTFFKIPVVMQTALLMSVNYCHGCERFLATEGEKGNPYGRCLREVDIDSGQQAWKTIPTNAKVSRCFFNITLKGK